MKKVAVIGHYSWHRNNMIGAVVKARNIYKELQHKQGKDQVGNVDIYQWRQHIAPVLFGIIGAFARYKNIVLVCSDTSPQLMKLFSMLKKMFNNKIHYAAVGGDIAEIMLKNPERIYSAKIIDHIYVETKGCLEDMQKAGFENALLMRNFKCISALSKDALSKNGSNAVFSFCTFSRVIKQKGILDAMHAVETTNAQAGQVLCSLDIYGPVDDSFVSEFEQARAHSPNCAYCGSVDANSSIDVLKKYDCLLFPTRFQTEGIPGTLVDAFAAGLPVICSDWIRRKEMITDYENGLVFDFGSVEDLIAKIQYAIQHPAELMEMKKNCLRSFDNYRSSEAIKVLIDHMA